MGANSFFYEKTPIYMGGNNENDRVASPESIPIQLKLSSNLLLSDSSKVARYADMTILCGIKEICMDQTHKLAYLGRIVAVWSLIS